MGNCLITKLNLAIDNDNLPIFGALRLKCVPIVGATDAQREIEIVTKYGAGDVTVYTDTGAKFTYDGTEYSTRTGTLGWNYIKVPNEACNLYITPASKLYYIQTRNVTDGNTVFQLDVSGLNTADQLYLLLLRSKFTRGIYSPTNIALASLTQFYIYVSDTSVNIENGGVDLSAFSNAPVMTGLQITNAKKSCGSILALGGNTAMTTIAVNGCPNVTGEINDFAAAQVAAGRTSGTIQIVLAGSAITDDGNLATAAYIRSKGGSAGYRIDVTFNSSVTGGYTKSYV